jgi:hypothetical protein
MRAQPPVRLGREQGKRRPGRDRFRRQLLEPVQHLPVSAALGQSAQLGEQRCFVEQGGQHSVALIPYQATAYWENPNTVASNSSSSTDFTAAIWNQRESGGSRRHNDNNPSMVASLESTLPSPLKSGSA